EGLGPASEAELSARPALPGATQETGSMLVGRQHRFQQFDQIADVASLLEGGVGTELAGDGQEIGLPDAAAAVSTRKPWSSSIIARDSTMAGSSSITSTAGVLDVGDCTGRPPEPSQSDWESAWPGHG